MSSVPWSNSIWFSLAVFLDIVTRRHSSRRSFSCLLECLLVSKAARYAMPCFEFGEELFGILGAAVPRAVQSLSNTLSRVGARGDVEQTLVRLGILHRRQRPSP